MPSELACKLTDELGVARLLGVYTSANVKIYLKKAN